MSRVTEAMGLFARFAPRVEPRVIAFHLRYEMSRLVRGASRSGGGLSPTALYLETSSHCRGRCRGCYVPTRDRARHVRLDDASLANVLSTARELLPDYVCIVGGEPLDESILETNMALVRGAPDLRFLLCTGSHGRTDASLMRELAALPNLSLVFSFDGLARMHDHIRGPGSHARTLAAAMHYSGGGRRVCGASVTLRRDTWAELSTRAFVASLEAAGCSYAVFDPVFCAEGGDGITEEILTVAMARLRAIAVESHIVLVVNPFGRLVAGGFGAFTSMVAASVDYEGHVYGSRRGSPIGNVHSQDLGEILRGAAFQRACRRMDVGGTALDDPRAQLFEGTLSRLAVEARG